MPNQTVRRTGALLALVLLAGCLSVGPGAGTQTTTKTTPTATEMGGEFQFSPGSETPVQVRNQWSQRVETRLRVVQDATNETVHDETYVVYPDSEPRTVYDLSTASSGNVTAFTVLLTARNTTSTVSVDVTECADVTAQVDGDGEVSVWATC